MRIDRVVIIAVAFTLVGTFYSLSELHRISALHATADPKLIGASEAVHSDDRVLQGTKLNFCHAPGCALLGQEQLPWMVGVQLSSSSQSCIVVRKGSGSLHHD